MAFVAQAPFPLRHAPHAVLGAFTAGLTLALALGAGPPWWAAAAGMSSCGAVVLSAGRRSAVGAALAALVVLAVLSGWVWGAARIASTAPATAPAAQFVNGTVVVDTPPVPDGFGGHRMRAVAEELIGGDGTGATEAGTRLLLTVAAGAPPVVGTRLRVAGRLRAAATSTSPGWWRRWLDRQRISARITVRHPVAVGRRGGLTGARDRWRVWATANAGAGLTGDTGGLVRGMALGGGSQLSEQAAEAFRDAGIWHLLAVSGQNVTVVALAALALLRALGMAHRPAVAAAGAVMVAYCLACDGGASVARAGTVGVLALVGELRSSTHERWLLLLGGLALLLAWQPRGIWDPGLQLSFAAVAGLFALGPPLAAWLRGWMPGAVAELTAMALAAGLATAPVVAAHFGRLSLVGFAVNIVAVPLAAPVVVTALAGIVAGDALPVAGVALAHLAGLGADLLLLIARLAAAVPGATAPVSTSAVPWLAALAAAPGAAAWWLHAGPRARDGRRLRRCAVATACVLAAGWALWPRPHVHAWPTAPAVTVLDVGQGDAILLRGPAGEAVLVDAGVAGTPAPVMAALRRHGVERLDALVVTHPDADHAGGAAEVIRGLRVGALLHAPPPDAGPAAAMDQALAAARERGIPVSAVARGDIIRAGPWTAGVLWPARPVPAGLAPNDASVVLHARAEGLTALLTGDAEAPVLNRLPLPAVRLLKVAHHGSQDDGLAASLRRLRPVAAVVSAGEGNPFGHPHPTVLAELDAAGVATWRTDRHGDVTINVSEAGVAVAATRR